MTNTIPVITIDGASGSGKGTISQMLASQLGWHLLDSGALYRVVAFAAKQHSISLDDEESLEVLAKHLDVQFRAMKENLLPRVIFEGDDITDVIRTEVVGKQASIVGAFGKVRTALLDRQRSFREVPGLVADGRDMGSVIFPDAVLKFYLEASAEVRAKRREKQLQERGISVKFDDILKEIESRDYRDIHRSVAPLVVPENGIVINTDTIGVDGVFHQVMTKVEDYFRMVNA